MLTLLRRLVAQLVLRLLVGDCCLVDVVGAGCGWSGLVCGDLAGSMQGCCWVVVGSLLWRLLGVSLGWWVLG